MVWRWPAATCILIACFNFGGCVGPNDEAVSATDTIPRSGALAPGPHWSPEQVVRIVLISMQHNDEPKPDSGIATAFRFASPANRALTGPLEKFIALVKTPTYCALINSRSIAVMPLGHTNTDAEVVVRVITENGGLCFYYIKLTKQLGGEFQGCWMTDAVVPIEPRNLGDDEDDDDNLWRPQQHRAQFV